MASAFYCPVSPVGRLLRVALAYSRSREHSVVLLYERGGHGQMARTLRLVDGSGVGRHELAHLAEAVGLLAPAELRHELALVQVHARDPADVAIEHHAPAIAGGLHHLIARAVAQAEPLRGRLPPPRAG